MERTPMTITKTDIIDSIYNHSGFQKRDAIIIVESLLEIIKRTLESGEGLLMSGFGKFTVKDKNKRKGRNPQTGNNLQLDARRAVVFKSSGILRENFNKKKKRRKPPKLRLVKEIEMD